MMQKMFKYAFMFSPDVPLTLLIFQQSEHKWEKLIIILLMLEIQGSTETERKTIQTQKSFVKHKGSYEFSVSTVLTMRPSCLFSLAEKP